MALLALDPFEKFASEHGLAIETEDLYAAPRDIRSPPADLDRTVLVELSGTRGDAGPLLSLFLASPE